MGWAKGQMDTRPECKLRKTRLQNTSFRHVNIMRFLRAYYVEYINFYKTGLCLMEPLNKSKLSTVIRS